MTVAQAALALAKERDELSLRQSPILEVFFPPILTDAKLFNVKLKSDNSVTIDDVDRGALAGRIARTSRCTLHIWASLAEQERKMISERTKAGLARSRKKLGMRSRSKRSKAFRRRVHSLSAAAVRKAAKERAEAYGLHIEWALRAAGHTRQADLGPRCGRQAQRARYRDTDGLPLVGAHGDGIRATAPAASPAGRQAQSGFPEASRCALGYGPKDIGAERFNPRRPPAPVLGMTTSRSRRSAGDTAYARSRCPGRCSIGVLMPRRGTMP